MEPLGHGEHFCIGAGLARMEGRVGVGAILDRLGDIELADGNDFPFADTFVLRGLQRLRIRFRPLPRHSHRVSGPGRSRTPVLDSGYD